MAEQDSEIYITIEERKTLLSLIQCALMGVPLQNRTDIIPPENGILGTTAVFDNNHSIYAFTQRQSPDGIQNDFSKFDLTAIPPVQDKLVISPYRNTGRKTYEPKVTISTPNEMQETINNFETVISFVQGMLSPLTSGPVTE